MERANHFQQARLKLTLWYMLISGLMLAFFTVAAIGVEINSFDKIQMVLSNPVERPNLTALLDKRLEGFESDFRTKLIFMDLLLLVAASIASYVLSGKTLLPIEEMMEEQQSFAAESSHELRTPLAIMAVELETLKKTEKRLSKNTIQAIDSSLEEIKRMGKIVEQLLVLVRPVSVTKLVKLNLTELVEEMIGTIKSYWQKNKKLKIRFINKNVVFVRGDRDKIKQIMMILLDNAGKYTPDGGEVTVSIQKHGYISELRVIDSGIGIKKSDLPKIFQRFYRGKTTSTKGAGLGLAIAKKLVEGLNGRIKVESELSKGSEFLVELPLA